MGARRELPKVGEIQILGNYDPLLPPNARAGGGPVKANTAYLVGESGPELFMPSQNGVIIPNGPGAAVSGGGGFGGGLTMNVTYAPAFSTASQSELSSALYPAYLTMLRRAQADGAA